MIEQLDTNMEMVAVIPARGGSRGVPRKNIKLFCGKPLIAWSIEALLGSKSVSSVWVSSDDEEILQVAQDYGARTIIRPAEISGDMATSESAWLHALEYIQDQGVSIELLVAVQATSPIRESDDFDKAIKYFYENSLDSLFSATLIEDRFVWEKNDTNDYVSVTYDWRMRARRQDLKQRYLENGSFYILKPELLEKTNNRLGGKIGAFLMDSYKQFQIDSEEDFKFCQYIMQGFLEGEI